MLAVQRDEDVAEVHAADHEPNDWINKAQSLLAGARVGQDHISQTRQLHLANLVLSLSAHVEPIFFTVR